MPKAKVPNLITEIPGPKSKALLAERNEFVPPGVYLTYPIGIASSKGPIVTDVDGNSLIDFTSGIGVNSLGHCKQEIVDTISEQANKLIHGCIHVVNYEPYVKLAEGLVKVAPGKSKKRAMFVNSGSEAVENSIKLIRQGTKRPNILSFENSFHGRTWMAMTLTGHWDPYKVGFGPFVPGVYFTPYAYCYRCPFNGEYPSCNFACIQHIEKSIFTTQVEPATVGAIIAEPVQGEGGFIAPPPDYFKELKKVADKYGIKLIIDEVQTGFGRTGKMWAIEHYGIEPDIMTVAKAIASGLPLSCVIAKDELMKDTYPGSMGGTYGGNPISCATGLKVLELIKREKVVEHSAKMGKVMRPRLEELKEKYEIIGDVRGLGPMLAIEFVKDKKSKTPNAEAATKVMKGSLANGLMVLKAGLYNSCIRLHPPLTIDDDILDQGMDILEKEVKKAA
jgi:4-aminobutyrate aminotransferase/(S)-3-amino-2-methylpropionate transaminase